jgi:ketosteroid isomerase-like protein
VTRDDLAVVSRMFACWGDEDLEGLLSCVDPELEWRTAADGRLYKGHDGARAFYTRWRASRGRLEVPLQRTVEVAPGVILAVGRLRLMRPGRGLADSPGVWLFRVGEGRITHIHAYRSEREAMEALPVRGAVSARA